MSVFMHCEIEIGRITQAFQHSVQPPEIRLRVKAQKLGCCLLWSLLIFVGRCSYVLHVQCEDIFIDPHNFKSLREGQELGFI